MKIQKALLDTAKKIARKNPADFNATIMQDAIKVAEHRFRKPLKLFDKKEADFMFRIYNKAADNRLSLKIYPDHQRNPRVKRALSRSEKACELRALRQYIKALRECRKIREKISAANPKKSKR